MKKITIALILMTAAFALLLTGCKEQPNNGQNTSVNNQSNQIVVEHQTQPAEKTASVQFANYSCVITEKYEGIVKGTLHDMGAKYARAYEIRAAGTMTGSEGSVFFISTDPTVGTTAPDTFSCGGWEIDNVMRTCKRTASSPETSQWSYVTHGYGEQVNVAPNLKMSFIATMSIDYQQKDKKTQEIQCPSVTY